MKAKKKFLGWASLKKQLQKDRTKKRKIVFTNGVFDLLHVGHLKVFQHCKKFGDVLVVGINSDRSVKKIKGPKRPIVPQKDRANLLAGLEPINYVTVFNDLTPERLIKTLKPDVLVKGGDWKKSQIVGADVVKKVVRIPLAKGRSSSNLIDRVLSRYAKKKRASA